MLIYSSTLSKLALSYDIFSLKKGGVNLPRIEGVNLMRNQGVNLKRIEGVNMCVFSSITPSTIFRSTSGAIYDGNYTPSPYKFQKISFPGDAISGPDIPIVTGIALDPLNPNRFWISFTGYIADHKVLEFNGDDMPNSWWDADPYGDLPNLPVNGIVHQDGTHDRLYIATDAGVYVKEENDHWYKYSNGNDLPNVRCTELKINYCINKLRVATYGRGVWEGDLEPPTTMSETVISDNESWTFNHNLHGNLRIQNGGVLTVTGCTVNMPPESKVIVEPGAKLIINRKAKFTNSCGQFWEGIEVWGNNQELQSDYYQGVIDISDGTIENAKIGVLIGKRTCQDCTTFDDSKTGGIIFSDVATFQNNNIGIYIRPYTTYEYTCALKQCKFQNTTDNIDINQFDSFIKLLDISGIQVLGCSFENVPSFAPKGYGITAYAAGIAVKYICTSTVQPCPSTDTIHSTFANLYSGIYCINNGPYPRIVIVSNSDFRRTPHGFFLSGIEDSYIVQNTFNVPDWTPQYQYDDPYGMYLDNCTGYHVEGNEFYSNNVPNAVGLVVNNSGVAPNEIYRNNFHDLYVCTNAQDENRDPVRPEIGLCYVCNLFKATFRDIGITSSGIAGEQVAVYRGNTIPTYNLFYYLTPPTNYIYNQGGYINYHVPSNPSSPLAGYSFYPLNNFNVNLSIDLNTAFDLRYCASTIINNGDPGDDDRYSLNRSKLRLQLINIHTIQASYELAFLDLEEGMVTDADKVITDIPKMFNLNTSQQIDYKLYNSIYQISKNIFSSSSFFNLTNDQEESLRKISNNCNLPGTYARNLLITCNKLRYQEPIILPSSEETISKSVINSRYLKVYPNPTSNYFTLECSNENNCKMTSIIIYNMTGTMVYSEKPKEGFEKKIIQTPNWSDGIYLLVVDFTDNSEETIKITVDR
jgi:hypothetical protein